MNYWQLSRSPRYAILFATPLILMYEALAWLLQGSATSGVRNGADVLLKSLFLSLGGARGLLLFDVILIGIGVALIWRDRGPLGQHDEKAQHPEHDHDRPKPPLLPDLHKGPELAHQT